MRLPDRVGDGPLIPPDFMALSHAGLRAVHRQTQGRRDRSKVPQSYAYSERLALTARRACK